MKQEILKMKKLLMTSILALGPSIALASGQVNLEIDAKAKIHINHYGISGGGKCGGGFDAQYVLGENDYSNSGKISTTSNQSIKIPVQTGYFGNSYKGVFNDDLNLYQIHINGRSVNKGSATTVSASITEYQDDDLEGRRDWRGGCTNNHYIETLKNASYSGKATLSYSVPAGVWAVEIQESPYNTVFKAENASNKAGIDGALYETKLIGKRIVWVTPGSTLSKSFRIGSTANKKSSGGSYSITFKTLGSRLTAGEMNNAWIDEFIEGLGRTMDKQKMAAMSKDDMMSTLVKGYSILQSRKQFEESLKSLSTQSLFTITRKLHQIAMGQIYAPDAESKISIRTLAALVSYEVASLLIEDFAPYCELTEHDLPYLGQKAMISDLQWGVYLMSRMIGRLETGNPELGIFGAYEEFLNHIKSLEAKGLSYNSIYDPQLMKDNGLFEDMDMRLKKSFEVVRASSHPQSRPIARSYQDLMDFYSVYETIGTNDSNTAKVLGAMKDLAILEDEFVKNLMKSVRHFSRDNAAPVDLSFIHSTIIKMKDELDTALNLMRNNMRLLSITEGSGDDSLIEILTELRVHSLNIVMNQYQDFKAPSGFDFEVIRSAYVDQDRASKNVKTVMQCLGEGGAK